MWFWPDNWENVPTAKPLVWIWSISSLVMMWASWLFQRDIPPGIISILTISIPSIYGLYSIKSMTEHKANIQLQQQKLGVFADDNNNKTVDPGICPFGNNRCVGVGDLEDHQPTTNDSGNNNCNG